MSLSELFSTITIPRRAFSFENTASLRSGFERWPAFDSAGVSSNHWLRGEAQRPLTVFRSIIRRTPVVILKCSCQGTSGDTNAVGELYEADLFFDLIPLPGLRCLQPCRRRVSINSGLCFSLRPKGDTSRRKVTLYTYFLYIETSANESKSRSLASPCWDMPMMMMRRSNRIIYGNFQSTPTARITGMLTAILNL